MKAKTHSLNKNINVICASVNDVVEDTLIKDEYETIDALAKAYISHFENVIKLKGGL